MARPSEILDDIEKATNPAYIIGRQDATALLDNGDIGFVSSALCASVRKPTTAFYNMQDYKDAIRRLFTATTKTAREACSIKRKHIFDILYAMGRLLRDNDPNMHDPALETALELRRHVIGSVSKMKMKETILALSALRGFRRETMHEFRSVVQKVRTRAGNLVHKPGVSNAIRYQCLWLLAFYNFLFEDDFGTDIEEDLLIRAQEFTEQRSKKPLRQLSKNDVATLRRISQAALQMGEDSLFNEHGDFLDVVFLYDKSGNRTPNFGEQRLRSIAEECLGDEYYRYEIFSSVCLYYVFEGDVVVCDRQSRAVINLESDGDVFHHSPIQKNSDNWRDSLLSSRGTYVYRFEHNDIVQHPDKVRDGVRRAFHERLLAENEY